jgi:alpha-tubulin suppressor-like RCC1 family protein
VPPHFCRQNKSKFTPVGGIFESKHVTAVRFGSSHALALCSDGTIFTWGCGLGGALGRGSLDDELSPAQVEGALTFTKLDAQGQPVVMMRPVKAIAAAEDYCLVLLESGRLVCWGNSCGALVPTPELEGALEGKRVAQVLG